MNVTPDAGPADMCLPTPAVLHLLPSLHVGGVERGVIDLCTGSQDPSLVASSGGALELSLPAQCTMLKARTLAWRGPTSVLLINPLLLSLWSRRHRVEILHAHSRALAVSARVARLLCWALGLRPLPRVVVTWHGYYDTSSFFKHAVCRTVLGAADALIFPSEAMARHVVGHFGHHLVRPDFAIIHRGVAPPVPLESLAAVDMERTPEPPIIRLLLPGRLSRSKGHDLIVRAAMLLHARCRGRGEAVAVSVVMMGARPSQVIRSALGQSTASAADAATGVGAAGPLRVMQSLLWRKRGLCTASSFERQLQSALSAAARCDAVATGGLRFEIRVHGDLSAAFGACDVVVVPSRRPEAFGRVIVEALAARRLVVTFAHGAANEIGAAVLRVAGKAGITPRLLPPGLLMVGPMILVAPCDVTSLAAAIDAAWHLPAHEKAARTDAGARAAEECFGLGLFVHRTHAVYRKVLG
jgi:glycosyltransferase involved in cell wall biosynthesis